MKGKGLCMLLSVALCFVVTHSARGATGCFSDPNGCEFKGVVNGTSTTGTAGLGVMGRALSGTGQTRGVAGYSFSNAGIGVDAYVPATTGTTYGVYAQSNSDSGTALYGRTIAYSGTTYGVYAESYSTGGRGVYGYAVAASGTTYGVYGRSDSTSGKGVHGLARATSGTTYGVFGQSDSTSGRGVYGYAYAASGATTGVVGDVRSTSGKGVHGWASATTGATIGVFGEVRSTAGKGVYGMASATTGTTYGVYGKATSPAGYAVYAEGRLHVTGKFTAAGTKSAVVSLENGEGVTLYAEEASENWFTDHGFGKLEGGKATLEIDPTFAQTVNTASEYLVFLTPEGDCKGLYVARKGNQSFEVRELDGGQSNAAFSYRLMARRKGYEKERLAAVSREEMVAFIAPANDNQSAPGNDQEKLSSVRVDALAPTVE